MFSRHIYAVSPSRPAKELTALFQIPRWIKRQGQGMEESDKGGVKGEGRKRRGKGGGLKG